MAAPTLALLLHPLLTPSSYLKLQAVKMHAKKAQTLARIQSLSNTCSKRSAFGNLTGKSLTLSTILFKAQRYQLSKAISLE